MISLCIIEPMEKGAINATTYNIPDFRKEVVVRVSIGIGQNEILIALNDKALCDEIFTYVRGLHTYIPETEGAALRGGKTFLSSLKPLLVFIRYRSEGTVKDMMDDFAAIMAIEAFAIGRSGPLNPLGITMLSIPTVMKKLKEIKTAPDETGKKVLKLNLRGHQFDKKVLDTLTISS